MIQLAPNLKFGRFNLIEFKGEGATAQVWAAEEESSLKKIALKIFAPKTKLDSESKKMLREEFDKMKHLKHPNLLLPDEYFEYENLPALVMPLCDKSLWQMLKQKTTAARKERSTDTIFFTEYEMARLLNQIGQALEYLHSNAMVHNDVKPGNILVYNSENIRESKYYLTDFGITKEIRDTILRQTKTHSLTFAYASPEKLKGKRGSFRSDIFSLGAAAFELVNGIELEVPLGEILNNSGIIPPLKRGYSEEFQELIFGMLNKDLSQRLSASDVVEYTEAYLRNGFWPNELRKFEINRDTALLHDDSYTLDKTVMFTESSGKKNIRATEKHQIENKSSNESIAETNRISSSYSGPITSNSPNYKRMILGFLAPIVVVVFGFFFWNKVFKQNNLSESKAQKLDFLKTYDGFLRIKKTTLFIVEKKGKCGIVNMNGKVLEEVKFNICQDYKTNKHVKLISSEKEKVFKY